MKRIALIVVVVGILLIGAYVSSSPTVEYNAPKEVEKEVIKEVGQLNVRQEEAWQAREESAKEKAQKAYEEVMLNERLESDLEVVRQVQTELDEMEIQLMASSSLTEVPVLQP